MDDKEIGFEEIAKIELFVEQCADLIVAGSVPKLPVYVWCMNVGQLYPWVDVDELYSTIEDVVESKTVS